MNLGMTLDSIAYYCCIRLFSLQHVSVGGPNLCIWCCCCFCCCRRLFVVTVGRVFIFSDGHGHSQADSSLQCRIRVCARVEGLRFGCWLRYSRIRVVQFGGSCFHGFDCRCFSCISVLFHCFSQRRVGGSYALRVSPAVTRLTVYRRPQVIE